MTDGTSDTMPECGHGRIELVALLREELPAERRRSLLERVETCGACAAELEALERTWEGLPSASGASPPAKLRREVLVHARDAVERPARLTVELWRAVRPAALPAVAALGAYLLLSLLHPIPSTVEFCQLRIFRDPAMSLGQICLVYAGVAALYAGVPVGVAAYLSSSGHGGWKVGLAEGAVFTLLALPVLGLQFGLAEVVITATVLAGVALGAVVGGVAGARAGPSPRAAGARG